MSLFKRLLLDPFLIDRVENVIEWWFAWFMSACFIVISVQFAQTGFHSEFGVQND
jgi:hypothetical protein